jgi:hypothetical protein
VSLVIQKISLEMSLLQDSHFQNVTKMSLHCLYMSTFTRSLKECLYTPCNTLFKKIKLSLYF